MSTFDTSVPHPARRYDYWLGGKDNFAADRESGDAIAAQFPGIRTAVVENRRFLRRAVRMLAADEGVRQFLDIGTGLPTAGNTHEIAPEARVVYVDNDPLVLTHARALLTGATSYIDADLRDPATILEQARETLDFERPIAVMLLAVLHFVPDEDDPYAKVRSFAEALAPGSFVAISHASGDWLPPEVVASITSGRHGTGRLRSRAEVTRFFDGLDLLPPGVVPLPDWRPGPEKVEAAEVSMYAGVARV
ncbi:SAM-dependent methyltransferase [Actinoplanes bogorensis]|uniref:SAM-dependent methyltransferase n=1 Tax=Paractinoplanes bogorensis TaxID=1610840 RepID=A0ABS5YU07_9ACTN|nr:SAM-dependent methyltransferase [Actinoplanes bogorensis]MBU2666944.1 SAM-dependent methyltransferase [Actinoplanes bogorensis]